MSFNVAFCSIIILTLHATVSSFRGRIVNGSVVQQGQLPFMVSLRRSSNNRHFCAGTILNPNWILTAAHCFTYVSKPHELQVQYGSVQLNPVSPKLVGIEEIVVHEGYNPTVIIHDIALLKLTKSLPVEDLDLNFVELADSAIESNEKDIAVNVAGWGLNATVGLLQQNLSTVRLTLFDLNECRQRLQSLLHRENLCAGIRSASEKPAGQCSGDSGGPLLREAVQIGIVSWSLKPCGSLPGVFTSVRYYTNWIKGKIRSDQLKTNSDLI